MRLVSALSLLAVVLAFAAPLAAEPSAYSKHLEAKAASVVAVKFVLKVQDREINRTETGVVVDPVGVVMLRSGAIKPSGFRGQAVKASVANLRVIFPPDEKEYEAIVGATDTKLGLAFIRIRDLAGKSISSVDVAASSEAALGDELFAVTRLEQGFDYAPFFGTSRVVGQVTKPRAMWLVTGFVPQSHFLYTPDGKPAGVVISQSGVTEGEEAAMSRTFLLPMKTALPTIRQGIEASQKALDDEKDRAKADAEEAAGAMGDAPAPAPAMGEEK
jgi:hypothetical protein